MRNTSNVWLSLFVALLGLIFVVSCTAGNINVPPPPPVDKTAVPEGGNNEETGNNEENNNENSGENEENGNNGQEKPLPVMGKHTTYKLKKSATDFVVELSGLCLSVDGDFLWGVGDNGNLYKINFDGTYESHWTYDADMEGITMDPATGTMYMGIEPKRVYKLTSPYKSKTTMWDVAEAADMSNSGIEGIAWHNGTLYLGAQTGATLWEYKLDGTKLFKRSLREVVSTISEIADLCYDPVSDYLWVIDSNSNKDKPQYKPYTLYLFNGTATKCLATYYIGDFANWNPETVCVDRARNCLWLADDCGDGDPSLLHKVEFTNL